MVRDITTNLSGYDKFYRPSLFALLDGLTQAQATRGQVTVMDINNASIFSASLDESQGKPGEFVLCTSRVVNVDSIGIETEEGRPYVEAYSTGMLPVRLVMPMVSYIAFADCGYEPDDLLEWDGGSSSLKDAFVNGKFDSLSSAIMQLCPNGIEDLVSFVQNIGLVLLYPNQIPCEPEEVARYMPSDYKELMNDYIPHYLVLDFISQVARGDGIVKEFPNDDEEPGKLIVDSESVQMLNDILKRCGTEGIAKAAACDGNDVAGYTYVTTQDENRDRQICFLGYFPTDKPKYSVLIWMQRREQLQDVVCDDWPELGEYAACVCKRIADYLINNET